MDTHEFAERLELVRQTAAHIGNDAHYLGVDQGYDEFSLLLVERALQEARPLIARALDALYSGQAGG